MVVVAAVVVVVVAIVVAGVVVVVVAVVVVVVSWCIVGEGVADVVFERRYFIVLGMELRSEFGN